MTSLRIDLRGIACPLNFVRAKLFLETVAIGQIVEMQMDLGEAFENVSQSLSQEGHLIVSTNIFDNFAQILVEKKS